MASTAWLVFDQTGRAPSQLAIKTVHFSPQNGVDFAMFRNTLPAAKSLSFCQHSLVVSAPQMQACSCIQVHKPRNSSFVVHYLLINSRVSIRAYDIQLLVPGVRLVNQKGSPMIKFSWLRVLGVCAAATLSQGASAATSTISAGDTAWLLTSTALVLLMTLPGLAFFYGGLVQKKNLLATMAQVFAAAMVVTITWYMVGFSMAFGAGNPYVGNAYTPLNLQFALGSVHELMPTVPMSVFSLFQGGFAIITTALIVGAFAERMKFGVVVVFCGLWSVLIYAPVAHWIWMPGGWAFDLGVRDFAGGMVVHVNAGAAALGVAMVVGPRRGLGREPLVPSNLAFMLIGAGLLWIGWFGFNGGSAGTSGAGAGLATVNTQIAAAVAAAVYAFLEWVLRGQCSILGLATGAVAGLVAITPAAGYVMPSSAFILGSVGGVVAYGSLAVLKPWLRIDDALDVFAIHGLVGVAGSVLTPLLVDPQIAGFKGNPIAELVAVAAVFAYSFVGSALIIKVIDMMVRVRVDVNAEIHGLDLSQHGEQVV